MVSVGLQVKDNKHKISGKIYIVQFYPASHVMFLHYFIYFIYFITVLVEKFKTINTSERNRFKVQITIFPETVEC